MKYYGKMSLSSILRILLDLLMVGGLVLWVITFVKYVLNTGELTPRLTITYILFAIGGIASLAILYYLRRIVCTLIKVTPFVSDNERSLKRISICCFTITSNYIINFVINKQYTDFDIITFDLTGIHTDFEAMIFFFAGCFILILSKVFKQAVQVKEENDLTI
ncbi:hypothetical protein SH2C18_44710 [Clostridium sediminicola]|uniref:DUF2975 domain-containing protein n=1 Tax=Clostridium sediminicola TaxID=3114879 RepID=UPI0031F27B62